MTNGADICINLRQETPCISTGNSTGTVLYSTHVMHHLCRGLQCLRLPPLPPHPDQAIEVLPCSNDGSATAKQLLPLVDALSKHLDVTTQGRFPGAASDQWLARTQLSRALGAHHLTLGYLTLSLKHALAGAGIASLMRQLPPLPPKPPTALQLIDPNGFPLNSSAPPGSMLGLTDRTPSNPFSPVQHPWRLHDGDDVGGCSGDDGRESSFVFGCDSPDAAGDEAQVSPSRRSRRAPHTSGHNRGAPAGGRAGPTVLCPPDALLPPVHDLKAPELVAPELASPERKPAATVPGRRHQTVERHLPLATKPAAEAAAGVPWAVPSALTESQPSDEVRIKRRQ